MRMPEATVAAEVRRLPGEAGIWVLIGGDLMIFGLFFATFLYYRGLSLPVYVTSQHALNQALGLVNTLVLLTSSLFVALAIKAARHGERSRSAVLLLCAVACGLAFVLVKIFEWHEKIAAGITLGSNEFFMFYFMYTGIHLIHVLIGIGVLIFTAFAVRRPIAEGHGFALIEGAAIFWHLIDMLWVFLFALFYLLR